jgi:hypothetical protein
MSEAAPLKKSPLRLTRRRFELFFQSSLVVLGAVLALGFSQWKDSRNDRVRGETALASIHAELLANRREVARAREYHRTLADRFDRLSRQGATQPGWDDFPQGLLSPARVVSTAWHSALATDAVSHIPYPRLLVLSSVYETQSSYARLSDALVAATYRDLIDAGPQALLARYANFGPVQKDFSGKESELLAAYDEAISALERKAGDGAE